MACAIIESLRARRNAERCCKQSKRVAARIAPAFQVLDDSAALRLWRTLKQVENVESALSRIF